MGGAARRHDPSETGKSAASARRQRATAREHHHHPALVIWEMTQACERACLRRRGCLGTKHHPDELTTSEGEALLDAIAGMGTAEIRLCGGDPALRHDLSGLVAHARGAKLSVTLVAAGTSTMTERRLSELRAAGLSRVSVPIHGFNADAHDAFWGCEGSFAETLRLLGDADAAGLETAVETIVHAGNERHLQTMSYLVAELGASSWTLMFEPDTQLSPAGAEVVWETLLALEDRGRVAIGALGAPALARMRLEQGRAPREPSSGARAAGIWSEARAPGAGCGLMFVSHIGELTPSPWLPLSAGNVRHDDLGAVYREHTLFTELRDPESLEGKCGVCEFRTVCGGSRARAWHATGSTRASDPLCAHEPAPRRR